MAILICSSQFGKVDWRDKILYLNQLFYVVIYDHTVVGRREGVLSSIASLGYGEELILRQDELEMLSEELTDIETEHELIADQCRALKVSIRKATAEGYELAFSGDMYPVLREEKGGWLSRILLRFSGRKASHD